MNEFVIWPAIDIAGGRCVRLLQGRFDLETDYGLEPERAAWNWQEAGASCLHVIDLDGAKMGRPVNLPAVKRILSLGMRVQVGGGLRTVEAVRSVSAAGARPLVGTAAFTVPGFLPEALTVAPDLAVALDVRDGVAAIRGWQESSVLTVDEAASRVRASGVDTVLVTDVERDGTLDGPGLELMARVAGAGLGVMAAGGVGTIDHVTALSRVPGVVGCVIGRALYEGTVNLIDALKLERREVLE